MERNFERSFNEMLRHEGGYSNHPADPGGATMKGVTLATFRSLVKPGATKEDLKNITPAQLRLVYRRSYWEKVGGPDLPDGLDFAMFDFAVNSGPAQATKILQRIVGTEDDGVPGPKTFAAVAKKSAEFLIKEVSADRLEFLKGLKNKRTGKPLWATFGKGWARRVEEVRGFALDLAAEPTPERPTVVEVDKPTVPVAVDKGVKDKTNKTNVGVAVGGSFLTLIATLIGAEWQAIVAVGGVTVVVMILLFLFRKWIVAGIKEIRAEVQN